MNDAIIACDTAIESGDATGVPDTILNINPDYKDSQYTKIGLTNGDTSKQVIIRKLFFFVCLIELKLNCVFRMDLVMILSVKRIQTIQMVFKMIHLKMVIIAYYFFV